jgi:hypothetical protein
MNTNEENVPQELKRKISKISLGIEKLKHSDKSKWKVGKCIDCLDWFAVVVNGDGNKACFMCDTCKFHYSYAANLHDK